MYSNVCASAFKCVSLCHYTCLYVGVSVVAWLCVVCAVCMFGLDVECVLLVFPCCAGVSSSACESEDGAGCGAFMHIFFTCVFLSELVFVFVEFIENFWVCVSVYQVACTRVCL